MDIFIDDAYFGTSIPPRFLFMADIDYLEINRTGLGAGFGQGFRGSGGILRIYTSPKLISGRKPRIAGQAYNLPLKFASNKKYYVPKYQTYNDAFYKAYGTVDWKPELKSDENGSYHFSIAKPQIPISLFIEGMVNNGSFFYDEKTIDLN
jgi:hypothetical protein